MATTNPPVGKTYTKVADDGLWNCAYAVDNSPPVEVVTSVGAPAETLRGGPLRRDMGATPAVLGPGDLYVRLLPPASVDQTIIALF